MRGRNCLPFTSTSVHPLFFWWGPCCSSFLVFVLSCLRSEFVLLCPLRFPHTPMFSSSLPSDVCRRVHFLFTLFMCVCLQCCPTHIVLCSCFVCLRLVYHKLPVTLDCPFLIALSVFSNLYINIQTFVEPKTTCK